MHVRVLLPGLLGMFAGPIQAALQKKGDLLLEDNQVTSRRADDLANQLDAR